MCHFSSTPTHHSYTSLSTHLHSFAPPHITLHSPSLIFFSTHHSYTPLSTHPHPHTSLFTHSPLTWMGGFLEASPTIRLPITSSAALSSSGTSLHGKAQQFICNQQLLVYTRAHNIMYSLWMYCIYNIPNKFSRDPHTIWELCIRVHVYMAKSLASTLPAEQWGLLAETAWHPCGIKTHFHTSNHVLY